MIYVHQDPHLIIELLSRRPLVYAAGADAKHDRPAHVRAASSLVRIGDRIVAIQDDANFLALIDPHTWTVEALALPPGPDGQRQFDDHRGTKALKLDLEAAVAVPQPDGDLLLAFGSGSSPRREFVLLVRGLAAGTPDITLVHAAALYAALRIPEFAGSELNIEGAVWLPTSNAVRLFQRGNGAPRGTLQPVNATCDLDWPTLASYLTDPATQPPPTPSAIVQYRLGLLDGAHLTFTDATLCPGGILYCAAAEHSPDAIHDGPVVGSALGRLPDAGDPGYAPLTDYDGQLLPVKVEGLLLDPRDPSLVYLVADADDPLAPSELLTVRLIGPWFAGAG